MTRRSARVVGPLVVSERMGKADQSDLLAAFLWMQEGVIGREAQSELESARDTLLAPPRIPPGVQIRPRIPGLVVGVHTSRSRRCV